MVINEDKLEHAEALLWSHHFAGALKIAVLCTIANW